MYDILIMLYLAYFLFSRRGLYYLIQSHPKKPQNTFQEILALIFMSLFALPVVMEILLCIFVGFFPYLFRPEDFDELRENE